MLRQTPMTERYSGLIGCQGARGHEQRALGRIVNYDAGNRQWHVQLVCCPWVPQRDKQQD